MIPWIWLWAPQIHYPYSGTLAQWVQPSTSWFFDAIPAQAGNGEVERKIFDIASYGRQLGLITEILLDMKGTGNVDAAQAAESLRRLTDIHADIETVKTMTRRQVEKAAGELLDKMLNSDTERLKFLLARMQAEVARIEDKKNNPET